MNCFPCRGPACNGCGKFDRTRRLVEEGHTIRCALCGGKVELGCGRCSCCGALVLPAPGLPLSSSEQGPLPA